MPLLPWNAVQAANTTTTDAQQHPQIIRLANGEIVVAWEDNSSGNFDIRFQRFDALGNKIGSETLAHGINAANQTKAGLTALSGGGFVVSWVDANASFIAQKFDANGVPVGGNIILSVPAFLPSSFVPQLDPPVIQALAGDEFVAIYTSNNFASPTSGLDLVGRFVSAAGVPGAAFSIAGFTNNLQATPQTTLDAQGNLVVVWTTSEAGTADVRYARFSPTGFLLTGETNVTLDLTGTQELPSVALLSNGNLVVTWYTGNTSNNVSQDIKGQVLNIFGTAVGDTFQAATTQAGSQYVARVTALADGKFLVIYHSPSTFLLSAQMFNGNGTPFGGEFTLTTTSLTGFNVPDIVPLADGRLAVAWSDIGLDGNGSAVALQIIDPREGVIRGTSVNDTLYGHNGNVDFISGLAGADSIFGLAGADTIFGDAGNDTLNGGKGDDMLFGGADQDNLIGGIGADDMDGGDGVDTASYALAAFAVTASLDGTLLGTNEALDDTYASIENLTGTNLASQGDNLRGNAAANSIAGLAGNDTINGVSGHDRLTGGTGTDTMTGGIGNDSFIYNTLTEGGDTITDFSSFAANNNDVFRFKGSVFGGLAAGGITNLQFQSSTADVAANTNIRFFYETDTRILRFDADGSDPGAAVVIATLQAGATMTFSDILIF